jgi:dihydrofolate synthase / folylpolyglutamate synthase
MRRLASVLGMPQHRFASIHVVGTNGKSSVAEMAAALLEAHGVSAGAYLSPHVRRWSERVRMRGAESDPATYAAAVERAAEGAAVVDRTLDAGDALTQFEVSTAAAFLALAAARVEVGVIEAGLGGRLDATNVIPSRVTALTSLSLEHTELLGDTEETIAAEKLDVLRRHSTLVLGAVSPQVEAVAERVARERSATLVRADEDEAEPALLRARGPYQRRNFAVARAAAAALLGRLDPDAERAVAKSIELPGRLEVLEGKPPLILDAAHNPGGARALAEALPAVSAGRPVFACLAILEGKDAEGIVAELAPSVAGAVCTEVPPRRLIGVGRPGARSIPANRLAAICAAAGFDLAEAVADPGDATDRTGELARERDGVALVTGTHYLLGYAWTGRHAPSSWR